MNTLKSLALITSIATSLAVLPAIGQAQAGTRVKIGVLKCNIGAGTGFIIGSTKKLNCRYKSADGGNDEHYLGKIRKYGIDIGSTSKGRIVWAVLAPTRKVARGALAGSYGGVSAEATLGVGLGANALIGGSDKSIALQPLSIQAQEGFNVAIGISSLELFAR
jgi:hypothetical protein